MKWKYKNDNDTTQYDYYVLNKAKLSLTFKTQPVTCLSFPSSSKSYHFFRMILQNDKYTCHQKRLTSTYNLEHRG